MPPVPGIAEKPDLSIPDFLFPHAASGHAPLSQTVPDILKAIRLHLGMEVAFVSEFVEEERVFRHVDARNPEAAIIKPGDSGLLEESYCQRVVDGRLPEIITDAQQLPAALELPVTKALPVGAHMSVAIRLSDGRVYGTFCCFSDKPDSTLDVRDLAMMRVFADFVAGLIEQEEAESQLRNQKRDRIIDTLEHDLYSSVYQPIYELSRQRITGFECLTRFSAEPHQGPDVWFNEANASGLGEKLESAVIAKAVLGLERLPENIYLTLNLSPAHILSGAVNRILQGVPLHRIILEITEHEEIPDYPEFCNMIFPFRQQGLQLAVDDAGAGYASFTHVLQINPDFIKLDIALTRDIDKDTKRRALAAALTTFARESGIKVVAEGVETAAELDTLRSLRVDKAQGYYLNPPMPLEEAASLEKQCRQD